MIEIKIVGFKKAPEQQEDIQQITAVVMTVGGVYPTTPVLQWRTPGLLFLGPPSHCRPTFCALRSSVPPTTKNKMPGASESYGRREKQEHSTLRSPEAHDILD